MLPDNTDLMDFDENTDHTEGDVQVVLPTNTPLAQGTVCVFLIGCTETLSK